MKEFKIQVPGITDVSCSIEGEENPMLYLFAHGAGAGYNHPWMSHIAAILCNMEIGVLRFNLPYMEKGKRPSSAEEAIKGITAIFDFALNEYPEKKIFGGGKSYGGRMFSMAESQGLLRGLQGLVFFGFPLHAPGSPSVKRVGHFKDISVPTLFVQGRNDKLAQPELLEPEVEKINGEVIFIEHGDHSLKVPKRSGLNQYEVYRDAVSQTAAWMNRVSDKSNR